MFYFYRREPYRSLQLKYIDFAEKGQSLRCIVRKNVHVCLIHCAFFLPRALNSTFFAKIYMVKRLDFGLICDFYDQYLGRRLP
jgi:hypothetical protein